MKRLAKCISSVLVASMLLTACNSKDNSSDRSSNEEQEDIETIETEDSITYGEYVYSSDDYTGDIYIEPAPDYLSDYSSEIELSTVFLDGTFSISHNRDDEFSIDDFNETTPWSTPEELLGTTEFVTEDHVTDLTNIESISVLPTSIRSGDGYNLGYIEDYEFCQVDFQTTYSNLDSIHSVLLYAVQEVNNNQLTLKFLSQYSVGDNGVITYQFTGKEITYDLSVLYDQIVLSYENVDVLMSNMQHNLSTIYLSDSLASWSAPIDNINSLSFGCDASDRSEDYFSVSCYSEVQEDYVRYHGIARVTDDGIFSFLYTDEDGETHTHHFLLFNLDHYFILANENGVSVFSNRNDNFFSDRNESAGYVGLNVLPEDADLLNDLTEEDLEILNEVKTDFFEELEAAFAQEGFNVEIDRDNGTVTFDASILFANNEYNINDEGQTVLDSFTNALLNVLSNERYESLFSRILIQGHTDSNGTYEHNVELSNNRASTVLDYLTACAGNSDSSASDYFSNILSSEGCASDYLIYNDDGTENMDASRRVEFIFYINLEYVNQ